MLCDVSFMVENFPWEGVVTGSGSAKLAWLEYDGAGV